MHEYSLHGQVASSRHTQLLHVLAGISAMPPVVVFERHLVFKPTVIPTRHAAQVGGSQAVQDAAKLAARQAQSASTDVYYVKLIEVLEAQKQSVKIQPEQQDLDMQKHQEKNSMEVEDVSRGMGNGNGNGAMATEETSISRWQMVFHDVPEPGARPVTARMTTITQFDDGDAIGFMEGLGYTFVMSFISLLPQIGINLTLMIVLQLRNPVSPTWTIFYIPGHRTASDPYIDAACGASPANEIHAGRDPSRR